MFDSLKTYLIEVIIKKAGPSIIKGAVAALVGVILTHQGLLSNIGIDYDSTQRTIDISLDKLSAWLLVVGSGGVMGIMTLLQHHTTAVVTGTPQIPNKGE